MALRRRIIVTTEGRAEVDRLTRSTGRFVGMREGIERVGASMARWIGRIAVTAVLALGAAMVRGTTNAARFRDGMAQVNTLLGESQHVMRGYERQLIDLAARTGVPIDQLTQAMYQVVSAGYDGAEAMQVLDAAARSAVGGNTNLTTAVEGVTTSLNAWGQQADQAGASTDAYFVAIKRGVTTMGELSGSIGRVAPLAAQADIPLDELLATVSALTLSGSSTAEAMTGVRGILSQIIKPTAQAAKEAERLGIQFDLNALKTKGLKQFLADLAEATDGNAASMSQFFQEIEGLNAILALTGRQADDFHSILEEMESKSGATTEAFRTMQAETTNLWSRVKNRLSAAFMELGTRVLPGLNTALAKTLDLMDRIGKTPMERQLAHLKDLGVDDALLVDLEVAVESQRLQRRKEELEDALGELRIPLGIEDAGFVRSGRELIGTYQRTFEDAADLSAEQIEKRIAETADLLAEAHEANAQAAATGDDEARRRSEILISTYQDRERALQQALTTEAELVALEGVSVEQIRERVTAQQALNEEAGDQPPPPRPPDDQPVKDTAEAMRQLADRAEAVAAKSDTARAALEDIAAAQAEIRRLESAAQAEAEAGTLTETRIAGYAKMLAKQQEVIDRSRGIIAADKEIAASMREIEEALEDALDVSGMMLGPDDFSGLNDALADVNETADAYAEELKEIALLEARGAKTADEAADMREAAQQRALVALHAIVEENEELLAQSPRLRAALLAAFDSTNVDKTVESVRTLADELRDFADHARAVLQVADAIGTLDDNTRKALQGITDLASGIGRIASGDVVGGVIQGVGGLFSTLDGVLGGTSDAERQERERQIEALQQNSERIADLTAAYEDQLQQGTQFDAGEISMVQTLMQQLERLIVASTQTYETGPDTQVFYDRFSTAEIANDFRGFIEELERMGVDPELLDAYRERFEELLDQGMDRTDALNEVLNGDDGLLAVLERMMNEAGDWARSIEGVIARVSQEAQFTDMSGFEQLQELLTSLPVLLSDQAREMLDEILSLDFSTQAGRDRFNELIEELYTLGAASGLSPDELVALLTAMQGIVGGMEDVERELSQSEGIAKAIRELEWALRYGASTLQEALDSFLDSIREAANLNQGNALLDELMGDIAAATEDGFTLGEFVALRDRMLELGAEGLGLTQEAFDDLFEQLLLLFNDHIEAIEGFDRNELLQGFLVQIEGLDLTTSDGQEALDAIIAQIYEAGYEALGLTEEAWLSLLAQLDSFNTLFESGELGGAAEEAMNAIREAIERIRLAMQYGGLEIEDAWQEFLDAVRDAVPDTQLGTVEDVSLLDQFLDQIEDLDLSTQAGQDALDEILAQMFNLGAGAFGMTEQAFLAMLEQLQSMAGEFELADVDLTNPIDALREAIRHIERALRFGAMDLDAAMAFLLQAIRDAAPDEEITTVEGQSLLDQFLDQIAGLDLTTEEGQQALADLLEQMFVMGAGAFGLDQETFDQILDQLQDMGEQFEIELSPEEQEGAAGFAVSRQVTEWHANKQIDLLTALLYVAERIADRMGAPIPPRPSAAPSEPDRPPAPPRPPVPPGPVLPPVIPRATAVSPLRGRYTHGSARSVFDGPFGSGIDGEVVIVKRGRADQFADEVYPHVIRRAGRELNRGFGHR